MRRATSTVKAAMTTRLVTCDDPSPSLHIAELLSLLTAADDDHSDERDSDAYEDVVKLTFLAAGFLALVAVEEATFLAAGFLAAVYEQSNQHRISSVQCPSCPLFPPSPASSVMMMTMTKGAVRLMTEVGCMRGSRPGQDWGDCAARADH